MIPTTVIEQLLAIGRSEHLEDPHVFDSLACVHDLGTLNREGWSDWNAATSALSGDDLVALVKALTMMENFRDFSGGSVAGAVWVYRVLEKRNPGNLDSLCDWISARTDDHWITGYYRGHLRPPQLSPQEQQQLKQLRKQADSERARILGELEPLSPRERLVRMAGLAQPPQYFPFPKQWADVTDQDLLALDAADRNVVIQWHSGNEGPWKKLSERMILVDKAEGIAAERRHHAQANAERVRILGELESLSPRVRLVCMAERASLPPHYFPEQWADVTDEELLAFDVTSWNALTQWLAQMKKGPWKRLHDRMKLIDDRHPWYRRL